MKSCIKNILGGVSLCCLLALSSCADDVQATFENEALPEGVPASVYEAFLRSYPEATDTRWAVEEGYAVATFSTSKDKGASDASVWYGLKDGGKKMQRQTLAFSALPEAVRSALAESEYAAWTPEYTAERLTRYAAGTVENIYILEVRDASDNTASKRATLYYTESGVLVKLNTEVIYDENYRDLERDYSEWLPQTPSDAVAAFISSHYPQAEYLHIYVGREVTKVKILDGHQSRLLLFDAEGNWLSTQTQLHVDKLPDAVFAALRASAYAGCRIDEAKECLTATDGNYYLLTLKDQDGNKQEIRIQEDGTLEGEGGEETPVLPGENEEGDAGQDNSNEGDNNAGNEGDHNGNDNNNAGNEPEGGNGNEPEGGNEPGNNGGFLLKTEIDAFIAQRYPGAAITDRDYDEKELELELSYNGAQIKVRFELHPQGYLWADSEWDLNLHQESAVPAPIRETIDSRYANFQLYFLKYTETAAGENYYMAGLKSGALKQDIKVKMDVQGNVLAEYGKH